MARVKVEQLEKVGNILCRFCGAPASRRISVRKVHPRWKCPLQNIYGAVRYVCDSPLCKKKVEPEIVTDLSKAILAYEEVKEALKASIRKQEAERRKALREERKKYKKEA